MCQASNQGRDAPSSTGAKPTRRTLLKGSIAGLAGAAIGAAVGAGGAASADAARDDAYSSSSQAARRGDVTLRWLGVAGWSLEFDGRSLLVDPYLSRFEYRLPGSGGIDPNAPILSDTDMIERVVGEHIPTPPDFLLITHGHWDHAADVPYLLNRENSVGQNGASWASANIRTLCTETTWHLLRSMGTNDARLAGVVVVEGGERLRFPPGPEHESPLYTIEVVRSRHSQYGSYGYFAPGSLTAPPARVSTIGGMIEGGTLGFQVTVRGQRILFLGGAANFAERDVAGLEPDVLVLGMSGYSAIDAYTTRALRALGGPAVIVPDHHDDLITPLDSPDLRSTVNLGAIQALRETVRRLNLRSEVVDPIHLEAIRL